jgi:hypothetical protein
MNVFGSVLADLPEEVFRRLREMTNVLFSFVQDSGVHYGRFCVAEAIHPGDTMHVITVPPEGVYVSPGALRGQIICEITRTYDGIETSSDEADARATEWGFGPEIEAVRGYGCSARRDDRTPKAVAASGSA